MIAGLAVGELCAECAVRVRRRAGRLARRVAMLTTFPLAIYVAVTLPPQITPRMTYLGVVLAWYALTFLIVKRTAWEWLK